MLFSCLLLLLSVVTADFISDVQTLTKSSPVTNPFLTIVPTTSSGLFQCPLSLTRCGSFGCYDRRTYKCCAGAKNVCKTVQNCVKAQLADGNIAVGCCPSRMSLCGDTCFDHSASKCCARPGGQFGLCPVGADCCADMCCDEGMVCANAFGGPKCWPESPPVDWWTTVVFTATASSANTTATIGPLREDCCGSYCCPDGELCAQFFNRPKCYSSWRSTKVQTVSSGSENATTTFSSASSSCQITQSSISVSATKSSGGAHLVVPWLLYLLLYLPYASASAGFALSPVDIGRNISEVKDGQGNQPKSPATEPSLPTDATSTGPTSTRLVDRVALKDAEGDLFEKGHGGHGGQGGGHGGSGGNSSASRMAIEGIETFAAVKIGAVHVAALAVLVAAVCTLI